MQPSELRALADAATPGPWERRQPSNLPGDGSIVANADSFDWVAQVQISNISEWRENARLIALAPDLALLCAELGEALEDACVFVEQARDDDAASDWRAILAKLVELEAP